jgi:uncharacterized protein YjdB
LVVDIESIERNRYDTVCTISPLKPGSAWIVAETVDGQIEDSCNVTVVAEPILEFNFNHDTIDLSVGEDTIIIAQINPLEGTYKFVEWDVTIDNPSKSIYMRTEPGYDTICKIRATGVGTAKIAAETYDGSKSDTCVIRVHSIKIDTMYMKVDTIYLDNKHHTDSLLVATIVPLNASDKSIIWTTDDASIVKLDTTATNKYDSICNIKSVYSGETFIRAQTIDGRFKDSCYVKVTVPVDSIILRIEVLKDGSYVDVEMEDFGEAKVINGINIVSDSIARLTAVVYPDTATEASYRPLVWNKLDPDLMRIDSIPVSTDSTVCYLTARESGVDTIYVTTTDGAISSKFYYLIHIPFREADSIKINVNENIVDEDTISLYVKDLYELMTTVYPWNATSDTLSWEITGESDVIKIDSIENGVFLNGLKQGEAILYAFATDGSQKKDSFIVKVRSVPVTGMSLDRDTVHIYENDINSVLATISPANATDKFVNWSTSNIEIVAIETSTTTDTICTFKGLKADTAVIRAEINGFKDSCVVIVEEQFAFVESDITSANSGKITFSLKLPDDITLTGSFELQLPKGFGLTLKEGGGYRTELEAPYKESSDLTITPVNDSTYIFNVTLKASPTKGMLRAASAKKKVMDIAYTIYDNSLENSDAIYDVKFVNVDFKLSDNTEIKEDHTAKIKVFKDPTGNEFIEDQGPNAYMMDNRLYVNSAKAETVSVYSLNGALLFSKDKIDGQAIFSIQTQDKVLVVRGSSGWAQKVANQ